MVLKYLLIDGIFVCAKNKSLNSCVLNYFTSFACLSSFCGLWVVYKKSSQILFVPLLP
ncbi:hypothetical protein M095_1886 [Parabacteroides distasonis str. 3999B T(B) 4]|nr:hypothetical protein M095_1886 [Parabacteroides distasonis str. 3999B T(B) 4]